MKIRTKVVVLLSAVFFALALVEWGVGQALLLPRFETIELDNAPTFSCATTTRISSRAISASPR
jgi:sensor domain CHASE-containing protein